MCQQIRGSPGVNFIIYVKLKSSQLQDDVILNTETTCQSYQSMLRLVQFLTLRIPVRYIANLAICHATSNHHYGKHCQAYTSMSIIFSNIFHVWHLKSTFECRRIYIMKVDTGIISKDIYLDTIFLSLVAGLNHLTTVNAKQ